MSILIKIEMPKGCWACPFAVGKHYECLFTKKSTNWGLTTRPSDCPLVEIPPHGDLVDRETLMQEVEKYIIKPNVVTNNMWNECVKTIMYEIKNANAIIEEEDV